MVNVHEKKVRQIQENPTIIYIEKRYKALINKDKVKIEVDTGAATSVIGEDTYKAMKKKHPRLHTYTVKVIGQIKTSMNYEDQELVLPVLVI